MPNVFDYLAWRGDLTFAQSPFNEADSLILCRLAYIPFDGIAPASFVQTIPLADAAARCLHGRRARFRFLRKQALRRKAARNRRAASALRMMRACLPPLQPAAVFAMHGSRAM